MRIDGTGRNATMLTIIDVLSRFTPGFLLQYSIRKEDVVALFDDVFDRFAMPSKVTVRSDNGSQFVSGEVRNYFRERTIVQEFIRPATPDMNAHIEGYHSIVQRAVCDRFVFESLDHAQQVMERFHRFYNFERLHSSIGYLRPAEKLRSMNVDLPVPPSTQPPMPAFFESQLQEFLS
jgi:transposase InsO family protein